MVCEDGDVVTRLNPLAFPKELSVDGVSWKRCRSRWFDVLYVSHWGWVVGDFDMDKNQAAWAYGWTTKSGEHWESKKPKRSCVSSIRALYRARVNDASRELKEEAISCVKSFGYQVNDINTSCEDRKVMISFAVTKTITLERQA